MQDPDGLLPSVAVSGTFDRVDTVAAQRGDYAQQSRRSSSAYYGGRPSGADFAATGATALPGAPTLEGVARPGATDVKMLVLVKAPGRPRVGNGPVNRWATVISYLRGEATGRRSGDGRHSLRVTP